jgi:hypothetical protein
LGGRGYVQVKWLPAEMGLVPAGVVTRMSTAPLHPRGARVRRLVAESETNTALSPLNVTAVTPDRFAPVTTILVVEPSGAVVGLTDVIVGPPPPPPV